jgi:hypothetical protein
MQNHAVIIMKKFFALIVFLILIIPSSVQASGVFDLVSLMVPMTLQEREKKILKRVQHDKKPNWNIKSLCEFGFRFNYKHHKCEKVIVPEHGMLNEDGISVRCEIGFKLSVDRLQCVKVKIPAHAQLSGTGDDFQCDRDFKRVEDICEKLLLPENSHIAAGGNDFDCNTGYTKINGRCEVTDKPINARFFPNSDDWYCESGYTRIDERCEALKVPANARASDTGTFFYCNQGYTLSENGRDCERVIFPENAEPNWISGWDCNQGYYKDGDRCLKSELPTHAKWMTREDDFYCDPTFRKDQINRVCVRIELPQNAEYDDASYGGWRCKQGFVKNLGSNSCDQFKLPEHAFWVGFNSWDCDAGFKKNLPGLSCDKVSIPENAHPSSNYDRWECNDGYKKNYKESKCEKV